MKSAVSFYLPERNALRGRDPDSLDPDRDWEVFGTGVYMWILQTYLRLRAAGAPVRLDETPPASGIVVAFADHVDRLLAEAPRPRELILVSVRADRQPHIMADLEIVQNGASVGPRQMFIPLWCQPALIPRDPTRGTSVERVAYIGNRQELDPELASPEWAQALEKRGLVWENRMITFTENDQLQRPLGWNDYSCIDVVVALRPLPTRHRSAKPASKLTNAWAAGVPAILSSEPPYRELRRSPLDYLEADSGSEFLAAIDRLRSDPTLYDAIVHNGRERVRQFEPDRLVARWTEVLWREIPARAGARHRRLLARRRDYRAVARRVGRRFGSAL